MVVYLAPPMNRNGRTDWLESEVYGVVVWDV